MLNYKEDESGTLHKLHKQVKALLGIGNLWGAFDKMKGFTVNREDGLTEFQQAKMVLLIRHFMECRPC